MPHKDPAARRAYANAYYKQPYWKRHAYERQRKWVAANLERHRKYMRDWNRKSMGLPEPTRPCPERCECCGELPTVNAMHLDHDHETGKFRGWLCMRCNTAIAKLGDDLEGLMRAVRYLERS